MTTVRSAAAREHDLLSPSRECEVDRLVPGGVCVHDRFAQRSLPEIPVLVTV
jgi:hypothetical protein